MKLMTPAHRKLLFTLVLCGLGILAFGLNWRAGATAQGDQTGPASPDGIWQSLGGSATSKASTLQARAFRLNKNALVSLLSRAPKEGAVALHESAVLLTLPLPDGTFSSFRIEESSNFEPTLADRFPEIKSYRGQSVDNAATTARFDLSPLGLHALVLKPEGAFEISPMPNDATTYLSTVAQIGQFSCEEKEWQNPNEADNLNKIASIQTANGALRRNYRIAIATTGEYYQLYGGNNTAVLASINAWLNAINAIYEKELAVHLNLVNNTTILFSNGATDPFTNGDPDSMTDEVRSVLRDQVGPANYDVGHVLGTNSGGSAYVGVICRETDNGGDGLGPMKGGGASGMQGTAGTGSSVGLLAHELGHQFGSRHNFNGTNGSCAGTTRSIATSYEVGSGSTIMAYSGICGSDNLQNNKDLRFHAGSLIQILAHLAGTGGACATTAATGNTPPTITSGGNFTVPTQTPFSLTATGNDADPADVANLTYAWEQLDAGGANFPNPPYGDQPGDPANTTRPLFRAYPPTASPVRTFPSLTYILNNANVPPLDLNGFKVGEALPGIGRTLNFRVTVRDNRADNGGINDADMVLTVDGNSGPFNVTAPNGGENITGGAAANVTWEVAGTNGAPINAANVKISLSTDGGNTFPTVLAANTPNDGTQSITFPNGLLSTTARIKIEAVGNIFFDISDANFNLTPGGGCHGVSALSANVGNIGSAVTITGVGFTGVNAVRFSNNVTATMQVVNDTTITTTVPAGAVTGPLTVVKTGCPDAQSGTFTVCPNPAVTLSVDDGLRNNDLGNLIGDTYYVNRLTPANYPATLNSVQVFFSNALPVGTNFSILTGTNPTGSNNIDNTPLQTKAVTIQANNQFNTYNVAPITITAGDFLVGWRINRPDEEFIAAIDTTAPIQLRSYFSSNGTSFSILNQNFGVAANLMIRAQVFTGNCGSAPPACPTVNNIAPTNGAVGAQVIITGTNFTGVNGVKFSNNVAATFNADSATQITATVPAGAITGPLTISKTGCADIQTATFTITAPPNCPTVNGLNPTNGVVGGQVVITGTNFTGVNGVKFSNNVTATFNVNSATQITATVPNGAVTGPIMISKTGCADVQTASFTVCTGNAQLLQVDNNTYNSSDTVLTKNAQTYFVNRLTPTSYPATLSQVLLRFDFVQAGEPITIVVAPNPTGGTNINNLTFQTVNIIAPGGAGIGDPVLLDAYNVPAITINSGDFVVGFGLASNNVGNISPMSSDNNVPAAGRSYKAGSLTTFNQPVEKNYFIRARYLTGCGGGSSNGLQFYPLASPVRLLDTRPGASPDACSQPNQPIVGQTARTQPGRNICNIPANAQALTGNVTTVDSGGGFLTLYPSDATQPTVASTNYGINEIINNVFTVGLGADGAFKIFANNTTDVVVDVTGYYALPGAGGLYFHPLPVPVRLLETRPGLPVGCVKPGVPLTGNAESTQQAISACTGIPAAARAIVGNATTVGPQGGGFLTIFPADAVRPLVAASNFNTGQVVNGPFSVGLAANGQFKIYTTSTTDLVVDVLGYYSTEANDVNGAGLLFTPLARPVRLLETRPGLPVGCFKPGMPLTGGAETPQTARGTCDGITIPANALGVVGNATVVFPAGAGFLTLWPSTAARPTVATSNYNAGDVGNRHFIVGLGNADGAFKIYTHATSHLVIDLSGYFAP